MSRAEGIRVASFHGLLAVLPAFPGKLRLADWAARMASRRGSPMREWSPWPGVRFTVDLRDRIQRQMWSLCYEPHITRCLQAILRRGDTFVDVGANNGYHSLFAANVVGARGHVFAFEPDPGLYAQLSGNLKQFLQAQTFPFAMWSCDTELMFERSSTAGEYGWGTLTTVRNLEKGEQVRVQAVSLDNWSGQVGLQALRLVKIDIEGSEMAVLRGARRAFAKFRPALVLEVNEALLRLAGTSGEAISGELLDQGYRIYELSKRRLQRRESFRDTMFAECICLPEESAAQLLGALTTHGFRV